MAKVIFYLLFTLCIGGASWVVIVNLAGIRRRRKSHRLERGIAEYLRHQASRKTN